MKVNENIILMQLDPEDKSVYNIVLPTHVKKVYIIINETQEAEIKVIKEPN